MPGTSVSVPHASRCQRPTPPPSVNYRTSHHAFSSPFLSCFLAVLLFFIFHCSSLSFLFAAMPYHASLAKITFIPIKWVNYDVALVWTLKRALIQAPVKFQEYCSHYL